MDYENGTLYTLTHNGVASHKLGGTDEPNEPNSWYLFSTEKIAQHEDKKQRQPLALAVEQKVFVVYQNSTHTLEEDLTLMPNSTMRDVKLIATSPSTVAAITSKTIRVLTTRAKLELKKSIDLEGVVAASMQGQSLLVATDDLYELVDLTLESRIPLFPAPARPIIVPVFPLEFLVVQSTGPNDPAMGLVVKFTGEASRQPIMWDFCPLSVAAEGKLVFALGASSLVVHSLDTQELVSEHPLADVWPFESTPVLKHTHPVWLSSTENQKLLGKPSQVASATALFGTGPEGEPQIKWYLPHSPLVEAEKSVMAGKPVKTSTLDSLEAEYLAILTALVQLQNQSKKAVASVLKLELATAKNIMMYIYGDLESVTIFPGLEDLAVRLRNEPPPSSIYRSFIDQIEWEPDFEKIYPKLLDGDELVEFLLKSKHPQLEGLSSGILEAYWTKKGEFGKLFELWYSSLASDKSYTKKIVQTLGTLSDRDFVWAEAMKLIKIDPEGVQVFIKKGKVKFDQDKVLQALNSIDGDVAYRTYLRHLVYKKKKVVLAQDLTMIVVDDLIEQYKCEGIRAAVADSYTSYRSLAWPKRPYLHFLQEYPGDDDFKAFVALETEFATLVKDGSDMSPIIAIIDEHAPELWVERCAIYRKLGLHNQCIDFLVGKITDYMAALWYCLYDANGQPLDAESQAALARYTLRVLASSAPPQVVTEHLEKQRSVLSLDDVFSCVGDESPASVVEDFLIWHMEKHQNAGRQAHLARVLAQGEFKWTENTLKGLNSAVKRG